MYIDIIDYGMGNLSSIKAALNEIGINSRICHDVESLKGATHIIIPGVGSFAKAMNNIDRQWGHAIQDLVSGNNAFVLGICLGMHLLASEGKEHGDNNGLGLVPGTVDHFTQNLLFSSQDYRTPHVGWNEINIINRNDRLLQGINNQTDFYFVHSYIYNVTHADHVVAETPYGVQFPSIVNKDTVWGVQFHPEKSGPAGFQILKNFSELR